MKLLLDENLPGSLVLPLSRFYPGTKHVDDLQLDGHDDDEVWTYAKKHGFAIVSKDSDFAKRCVMDPNPAKFIWVRMGNCRNRDVEHLLVSSFEVIERFLKTDEEACLSLGRSKSALRLKLVKKSPE